MSPKAKKCRRGGDIAAKTVGWHYCSARQQCDVHRIRPETRHLEDTMGEEICCLGGQHGRVAIRGESKRSDER